MTTSAKTPAGAGRAAGATGARAGTGRLRPRRNPWRHPWFLDGFTWLYLIWSLVPVALAVLFSFNNGRSQSVWQGFLHAAVLAGAGEFGAARSGPARRGRPDPPAVGLRDPDHRAPWRGVRARDQPLARLHRFDLQLRNDSVLRDPRAHLRRRDVLRVHAALHGRGAGLARGGPSAGHLERQLAGPHRAGQAGDDRQAVRGGGGRPRRRPVAGHVP